MSSDEAAATAARPADEEAVLVEEDYAGYNLVRYRGQLYALPQSAGAFRPGAAANGAYLRGETLELLHGEIDNTPSLLEEAYLGYNIVGYLGRLYALPKSAGPFVPEAIANGTYVQAETRDLLKQRIGSTILESRQRVADSNPDVPALVLPDYHLFDLVRYRHQTYALPRDGSPFDLSKAEAGRYLSGASPSEILEVVAQRGAAVLEAAADQNPQTPYLVDAGINGYNFVRFNNRTYAIRNDDGPFDIARFARSDYRSAYVGLSAADIRTQMSRSGPQMGRSGALTVAGVRAARPTAATGLNSAQSVDPGQAISPGLEGLERPASGSINQQPPEPARNEDAAQTAQVDARTPTSTLQTPTSTPRPPSRGATALRVANLRTAPGGPVLRLLKQGEVVRITEEAQYSDRPWFRVRALDGVEGWVVADVLSLDSRGE